MISKALQGATVERVYWAVNVHTWSPTTGIHFDSELSARKYAEESVNAKNPRAAISTRMVFRYPESHRYAGSLDTEVKVEYADYNVLISRPAEEDRY